MVSIVGASFTEVTVRVKLCPALVADPSVAVMVMLLVPLAFATGAMTAVQLGHVPPHVTAPVAATTLAVPDE
jgi:hypothetical protein